MKEQKKRAVIEKVMRKHGIDKVSFHCGIATRGGGSGQTAKIINNEFTVLEGTGNQMVHNDEVFRISYCLFEELALKVYDDYYTAIRYSERLQKLANR